MNRYLLTAATLILLSLLSLQCRKDEEKGKYTCSFSYYYLPLSLGFIGYTPAELDTVIILQYAANTGLTNAMAGDTIDGTQAYRNGDTAYAAYANNRRTGFFSLSSGNDYKVILPSLGKEYVITHVTEGPAGGTWTQDSYCFAGANQAHIAPLKSTVTGGDYIEVTAEVNNFFLFLKR